MKKASLGFMTLLAGALLFMAGCGSEDVLNGEQSQRIWKAVVPSAVKGDVAEADDGTRALFIGGHTNRYGALWDDGDVVQVYRQNGTKVDGQLEPDESSWGTKSATLTGTLTGSFAANEELTLYQPSKTMDFTGQKGTLQTASDKTYQTGTVTVESAQENTLTLSNVQLQYLNYYVRFLLSDDDTKERLHPSSLTLHAVSGGDIVLTMDEDGNVTTGDLVVNTEVADGAYPGEIFVALKPKDDAHITYELEARVGDDIYVGPITSKTGSGYGTYTPSFASKGQLRKCFRYMKKVAANTLTLSATEAEVTAGGTTEVTVSENTGGSALTGSSSDESVATVSIEGSTITITGVAEGTADITIRSATTEEYASASQTISVTVAAGSSSVPEGAISGQFTINSNGDKVYFSKGNLQYQASSNTWRFAENQYDYVGDATKGNVKVGETKSNNSNISETYTGWIDLFGWGTSGSAPSGQTARAPYYADRTDNNYVSNMTTTGESWGENSEWDWGYNAISNGGTGWRTLTDGSGGEWEYLFNTRTTATTNMPTGTNSGAARYTKATVAEVKGVILFPDNYAHPAGVTVAVSDAAYNTGNKAYTTFTVDASNWVTMESAGCVFLPAAGYRDGINLDFVGSIGHYWSSTAYASIGAYCVAFDSDNVNPAHLLYRSYGFSLRLVRPVE